MLQGGERIERAYWACVVAKVPIREQLKLYQDALEKARGADPTRDFPGYVGFYVERAEVLAGKELAWACRSALRRSTAVDCEGKSLTKAPGHAAPKVPTQHSKKLLAAAAQFWPAAFAQMSLTVVMRKSVRFRYRRLSRANGAPKRRP